MVSVVIPLSIIFLMVIIFRFEKSGAIFFIADVSNHVTTDFQMLPGTLILSYMTSGGDSSLHHHLNSDRLEKSGVTFLLSPDVTNHVPTELLI